MEYKLLINGALVDGAATMPVLNPATEEVLANCPTASEAQLNEAVEAAQAGFQIWKNTPIEDRRAKLGEIADIIEANSSDLARILTKSKASRWKMRWAKLWARHYSSVISNRSTYQLKCLKTVTRNGLKFIAIRLVWLAPLSLGISR